MTEAIVAEAAVAVGVNLSGERKLSAPLLTFLRHQGWVRPDTLIAHELPWHGRRIDMATLTRGGVLASYELKLSSFGRVLEQSIYNRLSFDRSYLVIAAMPRPENMASAAQHRVGVILVADGTARCLLRSPLLHSEPVLRTRLSKKIRQAGAIDV